MRSHSHSSMFTVKARFYRGTVQEGPWPCDTLPEMERERKTSPTEQKLQKHLCNWSCMTEVVLVFLHSHCSRCCSPNIQPVFTSLRYGFSWSGDAWCCRSVWVKGRRRGCCSSASNPTWSHRSARVYQAKAVWSLNAHAANLFNYSPSSAACLMRGLSTDNAGNWTIRFTHSIIDHWFRSRLPFNSHPQL